MFNFLLSETSATQNSAGSWWIWVVMLVLVVVMLVVPMVTNRRRMKEYNQMVDRLRVGDEVRTIGGVVGRVMKISKKDTGTTFILETGSKGNKTTMEFDINAVGTVLTSTYEPEEEKPKAEKGEEAKTEASAETDAAEPASADAQQEAETETETAKDDAKDDSYKDIEKQISGKGSKRTSKKKK